EGEGFTPTEPLRIAAASESLNGAPADAWFTGPGVAAVAHVLDGRTLVPEADREPTIETLFAAGRGIAPASRAELFALEPLYLRGSSAEEAAKKRGG
ncbi:MAG TPA: hypothetical protein VH092_15820, partial [Urbifossiella sp.]|nr:hypothetical protein [Urbifossiella sp.]